MGRESALQSTVLKYLNGLKDCIAENQSGNNTQKDRPDINCCWRGCAVRIELKTRDNDYKATLGQILDLKAWAKKKCIAFVAYSLDDVKACINNDGHYHEDRFSGEMYYWRSPSYVPED
jgi:hypothetical protein